MSQMSPEPRAMNFVQVNNNSSSRPMRASVIYIYSNKYVLGLGVLGVFGGVGGPAFRVPFRHGLRAAHCRFPRSETGPSAHSRQPSRASGRPRSSLASGLVLAWFQGGALPISPIRNWPEVPKARNESLSSQGGALPNSPIPSQPEANFLSSSSSSSRPVPPPFGR